MHLNLLVIINMNKAQTICCWMGMWWQVGDSSRRSSLVWRDSVEGQSLTDVREFENEKEYEEEPAAEVR